MTRQVKFYWWKSYKIWKVSGDNLNEILTKCLALQERYNAVHFEVLDKEDE